MPVVNFVNEKKQIEVPEGANLRKEAIKAGVQLYAHVHKFLNCHGFAQCGSCRVRIVKGVENAGSCCGIGSVMEKVCFTVGAGTFAYIGNEDTMRLACQTTVHGDMDVETKPPLNLFGENFFS